MRYNDYTKEKKEKDRYGAGRPSSWMPRDRFLNVFSIL